MLGSKIVWLACGTTALVGGLGDPRCASETGPQPGDSPTESRRDLATPSALRAAEAAVEDSMKDHFSAAKRIESATIHGRLSEARDAASELLDASPSSYPADWMPWIMRVRRAAKQSMSAHGIAELAASAGEIAAACGACHEALGRGPTFEAPPRPADGSAPMQVHRWATARMWEGVVGPSEQAWKDGTQWFPALPECGSDFGGEALDPAASEAVRARAEQLVERAHRATIDHRAGVYGEYLGTCATCHASGCSASD